MNAAVALPTYEDLQAELAERDFHTFVKASWPVTHPTTPFVDGWHVGAICVHLEALKTGQIQNLLITVAPRSTKSVIASIDWPAWVWIDNPSFSFMYCSFNGKLASDHSVKCRNLIDSSWYQRHWGDRYRLTSDQNEKMKFSNDKTGVRASFGMGGVAGQGATCVVVDDPNDTKDWTSRVKLKTAIDTYDSAIRNRVNNPNDPRRLIIMQRISEHDLAGSILKEHLFEHLMLPTEYDPKRSKVTSIGWKDPRTKPGQLLCEARFDAKQVALAKLKPRIYNAQHQQDPANDEGAIFKRMNWRYYKDDPKDIVSKMQVVIQSWDLTTGNIEPGSSKNSGQVWGMIGANKFLLDRVFDFMDAQEILDAIRAMTRKWPAARAKIIEVKAAGPSVIRMLRDEIPGIIPWPPKGTQMESKVARAYSVQPEHESNNLWLPDPIMVPWVSEFVEYCNGFPEAEFDDDVDCMVQALQRFQSLSVAPSGPQAVGKALSWLK